MHGKHITVVGVGGRRLVDGPTTIDSDLASLDPLSLSPSVLYFISFSLSGYKREDRGPDGVP